MGHEVNREIGSQLQVSDNPVALGKKRGRPLKKGDKDWQDDEIHVLIQLWAKHERLFNSKHPQYLNKNSHAKGIDKIIEVLMKLMLNNYKRN